MRLLVDENLGRAVITRWRSSRRAVATQSRRFGPKRILDALFQGVYGGPDARDHLKSIRQLQPNEDDVFEHTYLYGCLSILDTKAQGLLTFNSIIIAATTFVLATISDEISVGSFLIFVALLTSGISALFSLYVIWIHWTDTEGFRNSRELFIQLLGVRNRRTVAYRISWILAHASTIMLIMGVFVQRRLP